MTGLRGTVGLAATEVTRWPAAALRPFLARLEDPGVGIGSIWFGENVGGESMSTAALLLERSSSLVVATGIANVAARAPAAMEAGRRRLAEAHPGRFVLGVGSSHGSILAAYGSPAAATTSPLEAMAAYLTAMGEVPVATAAADVPRAPVLVAALGPRMLELAGRLADGAHPFNVTPRHTAHARELLGPEALLVPRQTVLVSGDPSDARRVARRHLTRYLEFPNYRRSMLREGFTDDDVAGEGSDRLVDAMVAWGAPASAQARLREHLEAGADAVVVQVLPASGTVGDDRWFDALASVVDGLPATVPA